MSVSQEQIDSIKELINVDHLYSKPVEDLTCLKVKSGKPTFKVQLSGSVPSTKLIKQPASLIKVDLVKQENKSVALFKRSTQKQEKTVQKNRKLHKLARSNQQSLQTDKLHPMLSSMSTELETPPVTDSSGVLFFDNLDAELDSILNDKDNHTDVPLVTPVSFDCSASPQSDIDSDLSNMSPVPSIETPLVSDMVDPFASDFQRTDIFSDAFSAELFPQLAAVI